MESSKYSGNFCPAIGDTGVISVRYLLRLFFLSLVFVGRGSSGY